MSGFLIKFAICLIIVPIGFGIFVAFMMWPLLALGSNTGQGVWLLSLLALICAASWHMGGGK